MEKDPDDPLFESARRAFCALCSSCIRRMFEKVRSVEGKRGVLPILPHWTKSLRDSLELAVIAISDKAGLNRVAMSIIGG